jgi:flagellar protein FlgJ
MDLMNLGIEQFNNLRFDSSITAGALGRANNPSTQDFRELMERARPRDYTDDDVSQAPSRRRTPDIENEKLFQLCLELETFLVKNLLTSMRNTVQKSGLVDQGFAGKIYEDMLYDEYAKSLTKNAGFGLAEQAYRQLRQYM